MRKPADAAFGKIRSFVWPIYPHELNKLVPMFLMLFFVCFNYSILRNLKDAIVITAEQSGAQAIPFIKVWAMLPAAIISTIIFTTLTNHFSRKAVFHIIVLSFLAFFFVFAFWIYPNRDALHPHATADLLESILPKGFKGLIAMFRNWTFTCFYVMSELWGSIVLSVLFWSFANEITRISEATRFYSVMSIGSNIAASIAGQVAATCSWEKPHPNFIFNHDAWSQTLVLLLSIIIVSGLCFLAAFNWMNKNVLNKAEPIPLEEKAQAGLKLKKKEKKLSFRESLKVLSQSKYLLCIATLVISYNLVIGLVEIIWKDKLSVLYPLPQQYNAYASTLTSVMGIISTITSLLMAGIISRLGWTRTALLTPLIMLITSVAFFSCLFAEHSLTPIVSVLLNTSPLALAIFLGSTQNCFSKAAKYSLFDATREMAFIPLSSEHKLKGKAAIDGIGSRLGKSGSSCVHQGLLFIFWSLSASAPYVAAILLVAIGLWILAVISLGKQFKLIVDKDEEQVLEPASQPAATPAAAPTYSTPQVA
jgi:ATP:ADP antiporter, AAA family